MDKKYYPSHNKYIKAGNNEYFIKNFNTGITSITGSFEAYLLQNLYGCRSISEHFKLLKNVDQYELDDSVIKNTINKWIKQKFLIPEEHIFEKTESITKTGSSNIISGCITCNRPDMLKKWFETRIQHESYKKRKLSIIICDDTKNTLIKEKNIKTVETFKNSYQGKIIYISDNEKKKLFLRIADITNSSIPREIIDFTFSFSFPNVQSITSGSNRNTLFAVTAGNCLYTSDDDKEFRFFSRKDQKKRIFSLTDSYRYPTNFHPDTKLLMESVNKVNIDLINIYENYIASDAVTVIYQRANNSLMNITAETAAMIEKGNPVINTICAGYCGGRWFQNPYLPLFQQGDEREHIFDEYKNYRLIRNNGINMTAPIENYIIESGNFLMGGSLCINNKSLIPPCLPLGTRDDTIFGTLFNRCLEPGFTLHLPFALYHNPSVKHSFQPENFTDISIDTGVYSTLIIEKLTSSFIQPHGKERLKELGFRFQEFGELKIEDFEEQLKLIQLGFLSKAMNHISYLLDLYEREPVWWAEDMERYYSLLKKEALGKDTAVPRELRSYGTKKEALTVFKNYLFKCGEMLQWWPEIWEAAKNLNEEKKGLLDI